MDAKARKVLNGLTKLGGEQEVFDLSIAIKMTEDAVQALLKNLGDEGLVSCRRDDSGKEFWSAGGASRPESGAGEPAAGKKKAKAKATAAGPDDRFDEFVLDPKAAVAAQTPSPGPAEIGGFEPQPPDPGVKPANGIHAKEAEFEAAPPKEDKRTKNKADADFEPKPEKENSSKKRASDPDSGSFEPKSAKELSAGPDDRFDEFAERVRSKHSLPLPLMAGAAALVLVIVLFIVGGGGKARKMEGFKNEIKNEIIPIILDSLINATKDDIAALRAENDKLSARVKKLETESDKAAGQSADKKPAAAENKPAAGSKSTAGQTNQKKTGNQGNKR